MDCVLLRHGIASPVGEAGVHRDRDRPLSAVGRARTRAAAQGLARLLDGSVGLLSSPYRRAWETAEIVADVLALAEGPVASEALALGGDFAALLGETVWRDGASAVICVGHEPSLSATASWLLTGQADVDVEFKKAAALTIGFIGRPRPGGGRLRWLVPPRVLRALGGH